MKTSLYWSISLAVLAAGAGCTSVQAAGPYVRNINVDADGKVSSFERCLLVMHYVGDTLRIAGEECEEVRPAKKPRAPPAPPASPAGPVSPSG